MGSGKSSVGRVLAEITGFAFADTDSHVARAAGLSIPAIFRQHGEEHFRDLESQALAELAGHTGLIVATGGGVVLREQNRLLLPRIGPVVWLDAAPDTLYQRVHRSKRPLLRTADPRRTVEELYAARRPLYEAAAGWRVDSTGLTHRQTARHILDLLRPPESASPS